MATQVTTPGTGRKGPEMASRTAPQPARFDVTAITLTIAGEQNATVEAQLGTRKGKPVEYVSITLGDLLIYAYDRAAVCAQHTAWQIAADYATRLLPQTIPYPQTNRHAAAIVLRLAGSPGQHRINGIPASASPTGLPHVRVTLGPLTVLAHDQAAVTRWQLTWTEAYARTQRIWPEPDAFDQAEAEEHERLARTGKRARSS